MGQLNREAQEIKAKIVYFGSAGAGMTANLDTIHRKLKKTHRGQLRVSQVPKDPSAAYEVLPVELGTVRGFATSMQIYTVPGGPNHAAIRRRILEDVDGIVFVADLRPERHDATLVALEELQEHLGSYGRRLDELSVIVQYNRRDLVDESALDALHRRIGLKPAAFFEAVATEGSGVLQTLTTLSKLMLAEIRLKAESEVAAAATSSQAPCAQRGLELPEKGFRIESAGPAQGTDAELQVPIRLIDEASGRRLEFSLRLTLGEAPE